MKVTKEIIIDGQVVKELYKMDDFTVYEHNDPQCSSVTLYFAKKDEVVHKLYIDADCCQNSGFVTDINFTKVG